MQATARKRRVGVMGRDDRHRESHAPFGAASFITRSFSKERVRPLTRRMAVVQELCATGLLR